MFKNNRNLKKIFTLNFLLSFQLAFTAYTSSSFLSIFIDEKLVGFAYVLGSMLSITGLLIVPKIFSALGGRKFLLSISMISIFSLLSLAFVKSPAIAICMFIIYLTINTLIVFSLDEILKIFSFNTTTGQTRGLYLATGSLAWIISQLIFFLILGDFPLQMVYIIASIIMTLFFLISLFFLKNIPDPVYDKFKFRKYIKLFFKNKNLFRAYGINLLLQFFYCWMVIYTPIYLTLRLGFNWQEIGIIFAIMLIPFVVIPSPLGKYADKLGERKILMSGFFIASFATLAIFFIQRHEVWIWALVLFSTRIGAAIIETMSDAYFFKHIKPENNEFIGIYRSATPLAYILGPLVAFFIFIFVPSFNFLYIILGAIMLYGVYLSSTIKKNDI